MKTLAAKKLCLIGVVFLMAFAFVYAASNSTQNTKSLKKHTDFLNKYVIYDIGNDSYWVYFETPTTAQMLDMTTGIMQNATYGFSDLGGQMFLITLVDESGNTTSHVINAKKSTAVTHSVASKSQSPAATVAKLAIANNRTVASAMNIASSGASSSTNK